MLNVDEMWQMVKNAMAYEANIQCPYKWIKVDANKPPWFTSHMSEVARSRDILFRNYLRGGKKNNTLYEKAVEKRKEFNSLIKKSRDSYFKEQLEVNKGDQVKFWQTIGDVIGKKSEAKIGKVFRHGADILCNEQESVEVINKFFATVGETVTRNQPVIDYKQLDERVEIDMNNFKAMTVDSFLKIVGELSYAKSSGIDDLNSKLIIDAMKAIPEVYTKICNESFKSGTFPAACKVARISVIPKKGDTRVLDNLRPIPILPVLGKVIEK